MRQPLRAAPALAVLVVSLACTTPGAGAASAGATLRTASPEALPPARIYVSLPREGADAPETARITRGLRSALRQHGSAAGGRPIRLVWLDDARGDHWSPQAVVADAERAAADPAAIAYVGERSSAATALAMPILNRAGLTHMAPVSTASDLTAAETAATLRPTGVQTFFRPFPSDARQAAALLNAMRSARAGGRVVTVDDGGVYGRDLTREFQAEAAGTAVRVVDHGFADVHGRGMAAVVGRVAALRPSAVVLGGSHPVGSARFVRALHRASPTTLVFGGDALATGAFARPLGAAGRVVRLTAPAAHVDPRSRAGKALGADADVSTVFAHNGLTAVLHAADRAARTHAGVTRESVRQAVFSGHLQTGLSGPWLIDPRGDAVYGAYDEVHVAHGEITTPITEETALLLRSAKAKGRSAARASAERMARLVPVQATVTSLPGNIQNMSLESAMMLVQGERARLLDEQLRTQIAAVQTRNEHIAKIATAVTALEALRAWFPSGAGSTAPASTVAGDHANLNQRWAAAQAAVEAAALNGIGLPSGVSLVTPAMADAALETARGVASGQGNAQQMDLLRLQSMSNKRNEAFDVMTNFVKKMQDSRASIIGAMR